MAIPIEEWYYEIPPVTRVLGTAAALTSLSVQFGLVHPLQLYFNHKLIIYKREWWRLITAFVYFGPISVDWLFHMFFLMRYSRMLEEGSFRGRTADMTWLIFLTSISLMFLQMLETMPFLGSPLAFTLVYIWSRRNPYVRMSFLGLFVFSAPFLPWVLLGFSLLLGGQMPAGDIMGIVVGHLYYFLEDVWPREPASGGTRFLKTPWIIERLIDGDTRQNDPHLLLDTNEDNEQEHVEAELNVEQ